VTWLVVTSVRTTTADAGSRPAWDNLLSLKWVSRAAIWLPVTKCHFPARSGAMAPRRSASGSVDSTRSAFSRSAAAAARSIDSGTSGLGDLVTFGNWPSGVICSATGTTWKPCPTSTSRAVIEPTPCSGVKTIFRSSLPLTPPSPPEGERVG